MSLVSSSYNAFLSCGQSIYGCQSVKYFMMAPYSLASIFLLLLPAMKISAFTISVNQTVITNSLNESSITDFPPTNYQCVNQATWFGTSGFSKQFYYDCQDAWDLMDQADFLRYDKDTQLEFLSTDATPSRPQLKDLQTPRRYTYGRSKAEAFICGYY